MMSNTKERTRRRFLIAWSRGRRSGRGFRLPKRPLLLRSRLLIAIVVLVLSGGTATYLYLPVILERYSRLAFTAATNCEQDPRLVFEVLNEDDVGIEITYFGFGDPRCQWFMLVDHDDLGFLSTARYVTADGRELPLDDASVDQTDAGVVHSVRLTREWAATVDSNSTKSITLRFYAENGLVRTGFSRTALVMFPAIGRDWTNGADSKEIEVSIRFPGAFIFSSSSPFAPTRFGVLPDGTSEIDVPYKPEQAGFVVYFESARAAALEQLAIFVFSALFGFAVALAVEELLLFVSRPISKD